MPDSGNTLHKDLWRTAEVVYPVGWSFWFCLGNKIREYLIFLWVFARGSGRPCLKRLVGATSVK